MQPPIDTHPTHHARGQRLTVVGVLASIALGLVKLLAGLLGNSYALVADAVESFTDVLAAAVVWGGLHISARPASEHHPYGYGKAEALAAFIVALLVFAAGVGVAIESVRGLFGPQRAPAWWTLLVLVLVLVVKEALFRVMRRASRETGSAVIGADAWHHRADAITSLAAFVGISVALIGGSGWERADNIAALLASGVIIFNAWTLSRAPMRELLDVQSDEVVAHAERIAANHPEVRRVQKVSSRKSGVQHFVDMHIWVDPSMNVRDAHDIAHRVKQRIMEEEASIGDVLIHIEPDET